MPGVLEVGTEFFSHGEVKRRIPAAADDERGNRPESAFVAPGEEVIIPEDLQRFVAVLVCWDGIFGEVAINQGCPMGADQRPDPQLRAWKPKKSPQSEGHQRHQRHLPPGVEVVGATRDQNQAGGVVFRGPLQANRHAIAVTAEDGGVDGEVIEEPAEVAAMTSNRVTAVGGGVAMAAEVVGERLPALMAGVVQLTAPIEAIAETAMEEHQRR